MKNKLVKSWPQVGWRAAVTILWILLATMPQLEAATIYVDNKLTTNCVGTYSIAHRNGSGHDGTGYPSVVQAANVALAGDKVVIRAGTYNSATSLAHNDVLWPKHSGTAAAPIVFTTLTGEQVVLGNGAASYPSDYQVSIASGVVTLTNVSYITIEGLEFSNVAGWVYGRHCQHIAFNNCVFVNALDGAKADARLIDSQYCSFLNCAFTNGYDNVSLNACDYTTVLNCSLSTAAHTTLALRSCNYSVIRNCTFVNPYYVDQAAEKLVEVYDVSVDDRDPSNPAYMPTALYNSTKHNLFESNFFGYHPSIPNQAAQTDAIEYSGQNGIIRGNVFSNPPLATPDPEYPTAKAGGLGIGMRWGGSWSGWDATTQLWVGDGMEAGYVTHNRIFNNVFYGDDNGSISTPTTNSMGSVLNPPPLYETNPTAQYTEPFAFEDNLFLNNIFSPGIFQAHFNWSWEILITGEPIAVTALGPNPGVLFLNNDFYAAAEQTPALIYLDNLTAGHNVNLVGDVALMEQDDPASYVLNLELNPQFADTNQNDFRLQAGSPLLGAGAPLTVTVAATRGSSRTMQVKDAGFFFDGFGIAGQVGDMIQLDGTTTVARVVHVDYDTMVLTLDRALSWTAGQGISLQYSGNAPNIGL